MRYTQSELVGLRIACRAQAENAWRTYLNLKGMGSRELGHEAIRRLDIMIRRHADALSPERANQYHEIMDQERTALFDEYVKAPDALKIRLNKLLRDQASAQRDASADAA